MPTQWNRVLLIKLLELKKMFFKNVDFSDYPLTDKGTFDACLDELKGSSYEMLSDDELRVLAEYKAEKFKNYMRPLFDATHITNEITIIFGE